MKRTTSKITNWVALLGLALGLVLIGCNREEQEDARTGRESASGSATTARDSGAQTAATGDGAFCEEHQIAEAMCPYCDPGLIESLGWCAGHDVPEAFCYQCNPALIPAFKSVGDWCAGHDRPESQCYICNPELDPARQESETHQESGTPQESGGDRESRAPAGLEPGISAIRTSAGISLEQITAESSRATDEVPRSRRPPAVRCTTQDLLVRFDSPEIARQVGLEYAVVSSRPVTQTLEVNAVVAYDGNRYAQLSSQVPGVIAEVHRDLGERVRAGDPLATINSSALGAAKASYLQAQAGQRLWERNHSRETELLQRGVSTERDILEAETRLAESRVARARAEQELLNLGLSSAEIDRVAKDADIGARFNLTAPFAGVVVERHAVIGEVVDPTKRLYALADLSEMWALLDVYESDARHVRLGQPVVLRVEGLPGEAFGGAITWVSSEVNPRTRTLQARAQFDNTGGALKAHMFAQAVVSVGDRQPALVVPQSAVQWEGCCNVVFVRQSDTLFQPRKVHLGIATGTVYQVLDGVEAGEEVVTQGSFLLKTEILKGSIGAGCCEVQPGA